MNPAQVPTISSTLIWRELDDGTVIVTPDEGKVRVLNRTGTAIWLMIDGSHSLVDITEKISREFEVSNEEASEDVDDFLTDLTRKGLIQI
ncbi:MAG: hypothetical protein BMS9Abin02_0134 [Anaerolineae bacterium]|nr:MAG: hypothetical protein BMS9Abin02_0134 [Anaerolineae bacterium]